MISLVLSLLRQYKRIRQRRIRKVLCFAQNPVFRAISGLDQIEFKKSFCSPPTSEFYKLFYQVKGKFPCQPGYSNYLSKAILAISSVEFFGKASKTKHLNYIHLFRHQPLLHKDWASYSKGIPANFPKENFFAASPTHFTTLNASTIRNYIPLLVTVFLSEIRYRTIPSEYFGIFQRKTSIA